jgi:hypothetical protein
VAKRDLKPSKGAKAADGKRPSGSWLNVGSEGSRTSSIKVQGIASGRYADVKQGASVFPATPYPSQSPLEVPTPSADDRPIWEKITDLGRSQPEGFFDDVPTDLARNKHHYLYGNPREQ